MKYLKFARGAGLILARVIFFSFMFLMFATTFTVSPHFQTDETALLAAAGMTVAMLALWS